MVTSSIPSAYPVAVHTPCGHIRIPSGMAPHSLGEGTLFPFLKCCLLFLPQPDHFIQDPAVLRERAEARRIAFLARKG